MRGVHFPLLKITGGAIKWVLAPEDSKFSFLVAALLTMQMNTRSRISIWTHLVTELIAEPSQSLADILADLFEIPFDWKVHRYRTVSPDVTTVPGGNEWRRWRHQ